MVAIIAVLVEHSAKSDLVLLLAGSITSWKLLVRSSIRRAVLATKNLMMDVGHNALTKNYNSKKII